MRLLLPPLLPAFAPGQKTAYHDDHPVRVLAPLIDRDKAHIVAAGHRAGVPFELTWSCYQGGERHCGRCGTCLDRREAFRKNGLTAPAEYEPDAVGPA